MFVCVVFHKYFVCLINQIDRQLKTLSTCQIIDFINVPLLDLYMMFKVSRT